MQKQAGFSLVELMVTIAIFAILLSIAIPNFIGWMPARRLESAVGDVQSALQRARMAAVKENSCVVIEFNGSSDNYRIFVDNGGATPGNACNKTQDADEPTIKAGELPAGVHLDSADPPIIIAFNSRGFPDNAVTISISLENASGTTWSVTLNITGSSRINRG